MMSTSSPVKLEAGSHFQLHASVYEKLVGKTSSTLAAAALSYLPLSTYSSSSHILDSACGPGVVTKLLLSDSPEYVTVKGIPIRPPPRVTGIDISPQMVALYTANRSLLEWPTAKALVQDSGDLSRFKDGEFDAVVMNLGIFMLEDPVAATAEIYRVLKPGGHAVMTTWKIRRPQTLLQAVVDAIRPGRGETPMYLDPSWGTKERLLDVMSDGGFARDQLDVHQAASDWQCESAKDLVASLSSPLWTDRIWKGWSAEEKGCWEEEVFKQLSEEEKKTASLEMAGWIGVAVKS